MNSLTAQMQLCMEVCTASNQVCSETLIFYRQQGITAPGFLAALQGCADICASTAQMIKTGSSFFSLSCGICAEVCHHCVKEARAVSLPDPQVEKCIKACLECAGVCEQMLLTHRGGFPSD